MKNILVVGVGGRTGTLFAEELKKASRVIGVAGKHSLPKLKEGNVFVERDGNLTKFEVDLLSDLEPSLYNQIEALFLTTKNPVAPIIKSYLPKFPNLKYLILSQNGFKAGEEAFEIIEEVYGEIPPMLNIIRLVLFNPVKEIRKTTQIIISYKTPVRIVFGVFHGESDTSELEELFNASNIEFTKVAKKDVKNMEFSKLFTNLIGIPSYSLHYDIYEGLKNRESFVEEILCLREYVNVVKRNGNQFLDFPHYPVRLFASLVKYIPLGILVIFRNTIAELVLKLRGTREKGNLDEIDYYTGAVVELAQKLKISTPVNERVLRRIKNE